MLLLVLCWTRAEAERAATTGSLRLFASFYTPGLLRTNKLPAALDWIRKNRLLSAAILHIAAYSLIID